MHLILIRHNLNFSNRLESLSIKLRIDFTTILYKNFKKQKDNYQS